MAVLSSSSVVALNSHFPPFLPPSLPRRGLLAPQGKRRCLLRLSTNATRVSSQKSKLLPITAAVKEMDVSKVVPQADRVLIKLEELPQKSLGGVLLPKSAVKFEHYLCGEVLSVGKEVGAVSVGQKVLFSDLNAYEVNLGTSEKLCFCKAGDLLALVE